MGEGEVGQFFLVCGANFASNIHYSAKLTNAPSTLSLCEEGATEMCFGRMDSKIKGIKKTKISKISGNEGIICYRFVEQ